MYTGLGRDSDSLMKERGLRLVLCICASPLAYRKPKSGKSKEKRAAFVEARDEVREAGLLLF